jgi:UvrD-like helicase C-terminal domain/AAA domain
MARMIPSNMHNMTTGEKRLYDIFRDAFPSDSVIRYEVLVGYRSRRPDFTIMDPHRGVCIVEVKDWGVDSIQRLTPDQVWVRGMGSAPAPISMVNPDFKCQAYQGELCEMLVGMASLRDEKNHLRIPVEYLLAFPNIQRDEFIAHGYSKAIPVEKVIFDEDLDKSGKAFLRRYETVMPVLTEPLLPQQLHDITAVLDPTIVLPRPVTEAGLISTTQEMVTQSAQPIAMLSLEQEEIAKSLGEGPRLLRGIAGTGKTMILLYRAKLLAANDAELKILILCWNTALATYMRQAYDSFPFEAKGKVVIKHFSEFVRDLLTLHNDLFREDDENFSALKKQLYNFSPTQENQYHAIYVDEAQDFRKEWIEFLFEKMIIGKDPKDKNFIIAADDAQRIYSRRDFRWDSLDFKFTGRSKVLKTIYRNSARIWIFSAFLLEEKAAYVNEPEKLAFANQGKYEPLIQKCNDLGGQIEYTVQLVKNLLQEGYAARNVLILYRHKNVPLVNNYPLVETLTEQMRQADIRYDWISEDAEAKRSFDWDADTVKISTVHSAKGMDSPVVILLGVETYQPSRNLEDKDIIDEVKLLYVAMTRAREFLAILYSGNNGLVTNLKDCERQYKKYRNAIITLQRENQVVGS